MKRGPYRSAAETERRIVDTLTGANWRSIDVLRRALLGIGFTHGQVNGAYLSHALGRLVDSGRIIRVSKGVYRVADVAECEGRRDRPKVCAGGAVAVQRAGEDVQAQEKRLALSAHSRPVEPSRDRSASATHAGKRAANNHQQPKSVAATVSLDRRAGANGKSPASGRSVAGSQTSEYPARKAGSPALMPPSSSPAVSSLQRAPARGDLTPSSRALQAEAKRSEDARETVMSVARRLGEFGALDIARYLPSAWWPLGRVAAVLDDLERRGELERCGLRFKLAE